jgi:transcriptional regulator with XRE-family HTH domain
VSPEEIKKLRQELGCSASDLGRTLGIEARTVVMWESGELFPTKRHVDQMKKLAETGPSGVIRAAKPKKGAVTGLARLSDPKLWEIVRKLAAHPALFDSVAKLADGYDDPTTSD